MLEKWLRDANLPPKIRRIIVRGLRQTNSAWANWYLEGQRYPEAREALFRAMRTDLTWQLMVKWMLARAAPTFARKLTPKAKAYTA